MAEEELLCDFKIRKSLSGNIVKPKRSKVKKASSWHFTFRRKEQNKLLSDMQDKRFSSVSTEIPQKTIGEDDIIDEITVQKNYLAFRLYIFSCVRVTDLIVYFDYFTKDQTQILSQKNKTNPVSATRIAFETIEDMSDQNDKFIKLLCALESAGYPKVVKIMKGHLMPVNDKHRKTMNHCAAQIFERLSTIQTLPYLYQGHAISYADVEEIQAVERAKGRGVAAIDLLFILPNRSRVWFPCFLKALKESKQTELADIIEKEKNKLESSFSNNQIAEEHNHLETESGHKLGVSKDEIDIAFGTKEGLSIEIDVKEKSVIKSIVPATQSELFCSVCKPDSLDVVAEYFCKGCDQYLCCTCNKVHSRLSSTQGHSVVSGTNMPKGRESEDPEAKSCDCFSKCTIM